MNNDVEAETSIQEILEAAESEVTETTQQITRAEDSAAAANTRRMGYDRSVIAWSIIATYAVAVIAMVGYIIFLSPTCNAKELNNAELLKACIEALDGRANLLLSAITTTVLPIVTLMLGFYFGIEKAEKPAVGE